MSTKRRIDRRPAKRIGSARRNELPAPCLRGFECAPNFSEWDEIGSLRAPYFAAEFRAGWRVPTAAPEEWDFRRIASVEEAREALLYEYAREAEWLYDYHAEFFAALTHPEGSDAAKRAGAAFGERWKTTDGGCPDPLFGQMQGYTFFPVPWMLLEDRRPPTVSTGTGIHSFPPEEFAMRSNWKRSHRVHAIEIDWSLPPTRLRAAFDKWMTENRPRDVRVQKQSGKDPKDIFAKLKALAAYRLKRAGLSRSRAQAAVEARMKAEPIETSFSVLPLYSSEGRWATDTKQVATTLARFFPDPRTA